MRNWCIRSLFWGKRIISFLGWSRIKMMSASSSSTKSTSFWGNSPKYRKWRSRGRNRRTRTVILTCPNQSNTTPRHEQSHPIPAEFHSSRWHGRSWCFLWAKAPTGDTSSPPLGTIRLMPIQMSLYRKLVWITRWSMCSGSRKSSLLHSEDDISAFLLSFKGIEVI